LTAFFTLFSAFLTAAAPLESDLSLIIAGAALQPQPLVGPHASCLLSLRALVYSTEEAAKSMANTRTEALIFILFYIFLIKD